MKYISNDELRREIAISLERGEMTEEYGKMVLFIVKFYYSNNRWRRINKSTKDMFISDFIMWLVTDRRDGRPGWVRIDLRNPRSVIQKKAGQIALDRIKYEKIRTRREKMITEIVDGYLFVINQRSCGGDYE